MDTPTPTVTIRKHIAPAIIAALGGTLGGTVKPEDEDRITPPDRATIILPPPCPEGSALYITWTGRRWEQRIKVDGAWPMPDNMSYAPPSCYYDGLGSCPSITLSSKRPVEALIKDIQRRFLPTYLDLYVKILDRLAQERAAANNMASATENLYRILEGTVWPNQSERIKEGKLYYSVRQVYLDARVGVGSAGATLRIEHGSFPIELANRIATLIRDFNSQPAETTANL